MAICVAFHLGDVGRLRLDPRARFPIARSAVTMTPRRSSAARVAKRAVPMPRAIFERAATAARASPRMSGPARPTARSTSTAARAIHPLVMGSTAQLPGVKALWGTTSTFVLGVGAEGLALRFDGTNWVKDVVASSALGDAERRRGRECDRRVGRRSRPCLPFRRQRLVRYHAAPPTNDEPFFAVWMSGPGEGWACGQAGNIWQLTGGNCDQERPRGQRLRQERFVGQQRDRCLDGRRASLARDGLAAVDRALRRSRPGAMAPGGLDPNGALPAAHRGVGARREPRVGCRRQRHGRVLERPGLGLATLGHHRRISCRCRGSGDERMSGSPARLPCTTSTARYGNRRSPGLTSAPVVGAAERELSRG